MNNITMVVFCIFGGLFVTYLIVRYLLPRLRTPTPRNVRYSVGPVTVWDVYSIHAERGEGEEDWSIVSENFQGKVEIADWESDDCVITALKRNHYFYGDEMVYVEQDGMLLLLKATCDDCPFILLSRAG